MNLHKPAMIAALLTLTAAFGFAADGKLAPDLAGVQSDRLVDVIIRYRVQPQTRNHSMMAQRGAHFQRGLEMLNSAAYRVPASTLRDLENDPDVEYISPDRPVAATMDYAEPAVTADIALKYGWDGNGITVAVIDSGIMDSHPDLTDAAGKSRVVYAETFNFSEGNDYFDRYGHGTHVAAILGGDASKSSGTGYTRTFRGIAPKVRFVSLRVLDRQGHGTDSMVIAAIQRAIALKSTYNIKVINLSLGRPIVESYKTDPLCQAVEQAWKAGIVVVVAAGNDGRNNSKGNQGYGTITSPANDPYVITVGAMKDMRTLARADDQMSSYSSKGPTIFDQVVKPDIVAPGNRIIGSIPTGLALTNTYPANKVALSYYVTGGTSQKSDYYFELSGTSMASPMVAGAAALLLQKTPTLTPDQVKAKLMLTAGKTFPVSSVAKDPKTGVFYTVYYDIFTVGAGYLDVWAALSNAATIPTSQNALSPSVEFKVSPTQVVLVNAANAMWGQANTALKAVWGDTVLQANQAVSSTKAVWGDSTVAGFKAVWGDTAIWSSSTPAAELMDIALNGEE